MALECKLRGVKLRILELFVPFSNSSLETINVAACVSVTFRPLTSPLTGQQQEAAADSPLCPAHLGGPPHTHTHSGILTLSEGGGNVESQDSSRLAGRLLI